MFTGFYTVDCFSINTVVHVSFLTGVFIFTGYILSSEIAGSYGNCIFSLFVCLFLNSILGTEMDRRFKREGIYAYIWLIHVEV